MKAGEKPTSLQDAVADLLIDKCHIVPMLREPRERGHLARFGDAVFRFSQLEGRSHRERFGAGKMPALPGADANGVLVKVCGVCSLQDAALAIECGANLIGLIFVESSRRKIDPTEAMSICSSLRGRARFVGVFQNATVSYINELVAKMQLSDVQLHGDESPEFCRSVNGSVIKAFSVDKSSAANLTEPFDGLVSKFLFDRPKSRVDPGWRNELLDFLARRKSSSTPYFVAGGLDRFNVPEVLELLSPHAVDVASGIESRPGVKDPEKMRRFIEEVRNYD